MSALALIALSLAAVKHRPPAPFERAPKVSEALFRTREPRQTQGFFQRAHAAPRLLPRHWVMPAVRPTVDG